MTREDAVFEIEETVAFEQSIEVVWSFVMDETNEPLRQRNLKGVLEGGIEEAPRGPHPVAQASS